MRINLNHQEVSSLHFLWEDEKNKGADACLGHVLEAFVDCDNVKNIDRYFFIIIISLCQIKVYLTVFPIGIYLLDTPNN